MLASTPRAFWRVHDNLNPHEVRACENLDSAEQPNSLAMSVLFDVTRPMRNVPRVPQAKLPDLFGLLLRKRS